MGLRPRVSPGEPRSSRSAASKSAYASTTHCTSTAVALRLVCSAGSATLTTVPSMNTMLDPRIVAARIHRPSFLLHGASTFFAAITPSSHGGLTRFIDREILNHFGGETAGAKAGRFLAGRWSGSLTAKRLPEHSPGLPRG